MNYELILAGLNELKSGNLIDDRKGICFNLSWKIDESRGKMADAFIEQCFIHLFGAPVCAPVEGDIISYLHNKHKWDKETDMGLRRFDLLDKMIAYAEEQLQGEEA